MKKKKSLILIIALLLVAVTSGVVTLTYSRYISTATGTDTAKVAPWKINVNNTDIVANNTFTTDTIIWSQSSYTSEGYIAPGRTGTFEIEIDPTGSKVALEYKIAIDTTAITNSNITISSVKVGATELVGSNGIYTDNFTLAEVESGNTKIVTVTISWTDENTDTANTADTTTGQAATDISIPVTVTATQLVG